MASTGLHEPEERLTPETRELHRAIVSLGEELEAIDWYQQRADACGDDALRAVLLHNRREEIEHAMMILEWIRRASPEFDVNVRKYLMKEGPITGIEAAAKAKLDGATSPVEPTSPPPLGLGGSLGLGSLRLRLPPSTTSGGEV